MRNRLVSQRLINQAYQRNLLLEEATRGLQQKTLQLRVLVLRSVKLGVDPVATFRAKSDWFVPYLQNVLFRGDLQGRLDSHKQYLRRQKVNTKRFAISDAIKVAKFRESLTVPQVKALTRVYGSRATEIGVNYSRLVEAKLRKTIADCIAGNFHVRDTAEAIGDTLAVVGISEKPFRLEQMARDQINLSYMAGRLSANKDPVIDSELWGYEYVVVDDDRVRPEHLVLDGIRKPKNDPFWKAHMPPNGYNCRCSVIEIFNDETSEADRQESDTPSDIPTEYEGEPIVAGADKGWDFNPGDVFDTGLPPVDFLE